MANLEAAQQYADIVEASANATDPPVPVELAQGLIDHETGSTWDPASIRQEPAISDASRGLTQILYRTAVGLGFLGSPEDLFDPYVNVPLGLKYLALQYQLAGSWPGALSAYNGGFRPYQGFGRPVTEPTTVVLARDQVTGQPVRTFTAQPGQYANQPYVDAVLKAAAAFGYGGGSGVQTAGLVWILGLGLGAAALVRAGKGLGWW